MQRQQAGSVKVKTDPGKKDAASDMPAHRDCLLVNKLSPPTIGAPAGLRVKGRPAAAPELAAAVRVWPLPATARQAWPGEGTAVRLPCKHKRPSQRLSSTWFSERLPCLLFPQITQAKITFMPQKHILGCKGCSPSPVNTLFLKFLSPDPLQCG